MYAADDDDDDVSDECADRLLATLLPLHTLKQSHGSIVSDPILLTCSQLAQTRLSKFGSVVVQIHLQSPQPPSN